MFPNPAIGPPALAPYQLSYRGLTFGGIIPGAPYQLQSLAGLDMPGVAAADTQRPLDQGELVGIDVSQGRDITVTQVVQGDNVSLDHARQALAGVLGVAGNIESPLFLQLPSGCFACMARPRKHNFTLDVNMLVAKGGVATSLLHASDPRWYASPSKSQTVSLPAPLGGMTFPATFPLSFGGGGTGGVLTVVNNGTFEMRPVLVVRGPCTNPTIQNLSLPGSPQVSFAISLVTGDTLTVDMDYESVVYTPVGSPSGTSRRNTIVAGSTWFNFIPGTNIVQFTTSDGVQVAGTLTVQSADAYAGL